MQELICSCWKGHTLLFEHQMPQNTLIQPPKQKPSLFFISLCLTLSCKLGAGQEIKPASHTCSPVCDCAWDSATRPGCSLGFPSVPGSHHTEQMSQACGCLLKKPVMGPAVKPGTQWLCLTWWGQGGAAPRTSAVRAPPGCSTQGLPFHAPLQTGRDTLVKKTSGFTCE